MSKKGKKIPTSDVTMTLRVIIKTCKLYNPKLISVDVVLEGCSLGLDKR